MSDVFAEISATPIDPDVVDDFVLSPENGAVVSFQGVVRNHDQEREVAALDYQSHPDAERVLRECCERIAGETGLRVAAIHRTGALRIGDIALVAAVAAPHRAEAFAACADLVELIKQSVPIWKRQHFPSGTPEWVGLDTPAEQADTSDSRAVSPSAEGAPPIRPPAVVEPGPPLAAHRLARFSRQLLLPGFGEIAQRRLAHARVLVVGAGGLGSASVPYLASAGVGTIGVLDTDVVELSNLHRQVVHGVTDIGRSKVDSIADAISAIDPDVTVNRHRMRLDAGNALELVSDYDLIVDGSDNFATRYLTNDVAAITRKPLVWGAILRYSGQAGVAYAGFGPTYRDLFPTPPDADDVLSCSEGGVLPSVCAAIGSIMATETIKLLTGLGEPLLGRITTYDALTGRFRELSYGALPDAEPITELTDYELFCRTVRADDARASAERTADQTISPLELSLRLAAREPLQLVDVREPFEREIASIPGSELIPLGTIETSPARIRRDIPVVVYCHHGSRAALASAILRAQGVQNVQVLDGGIDAFAATVDRSMTRY
jgi:adenylyltransferase/sulfurtransferase